METPIKLYPQLPILRLCLKQINNLGYCQEYFVKANMIYCIVIGGVNHRKNCYNVIPQFIAHCLILYALEITLENKHT